MLPFLTVYDEAQDIGLGLVAPFDLPKPGLCFRLDQQDNGLEVSGDNVLITQGVIAVPSVAVKSRCTDPAGLASGRTTPH